MASSSVLTLIPSRSEIVSNKTKLGSGGGLYIASDGRADIRDSTIHKNSGLQGGGIRWAAGDLHILNSTVSGNLSTAGGGLMVCSAIGELKASNVTFSDNEAVEDGGGVYVCANAAVSLANVTITNNRVDQDDNDGKGGNGGGIYVRNGGTASLQNSIVAHNHDGTNFPGARAADCYGTITSGGYNIIRSLGTSLGGPLCTISGTVAGNQIGVDAGLDPLDDYGGYTETHALATGSLAINAGNSGGCIGAHNALLTSDQRGTLRTNRCDIGAFEYGGLVEKVSLPAILRP